MSSQSENEPHEFTAGDARRVVRIPGPADDKYRRGVLGVQTGSSAYPGAAVLGVEAAVRTGVGMVRYLGDSAPTSLVLQRRPEVVTAPGRVQAWLLGSGMNTEERSGEVARRLDAAIAEQVPRVLDAGALDLAAHADRATIITPHAGELSSLWGDAGESVERSAIEADPTSWARRSAEHFGVTVLVKGVRTIVASPGGACMSVTASSSWAATAGSGDVLGGILGALLATNAEHIDSYDGDGLASIAAAAAFLHQAAAARASAGGPISALDIAEALPGTISELVRAELR